MATHQVESDTIRGKFYTVDTDKMTCTCKFFEFRKKCKHLDTIVSEQGVCPTSQTKLVMYPNTNKEQKDRLSAYDTWTRQRVSKNFILREFLYSSRADYFGVSNKPSDHPEQVVASAKALCELLLEPILKKFGKFFITYGYQSRKILDTLYPNDNKKSSSPHQWDRGTFSSGIYARVDIVPICVEDGEVTHEEFMNWVMYNTPADLLMFWRGTNTFCISIAPSPRRVALEWVSTGKGDNGSNKITYYGTHFWNNIYPTLEESQKPKFSPPVSGGSMYFSK